MAAASKANTRKIRNLNDEKDQPEFRVNIASYNESSPRGERFGTKDEYGFGVPFSYWEKHDIYPYCKPKYSSLKEELLQNSIHPLAKERYDIIYKKGEELHPKISSILGQDGDKNTAFANYVTHWNDYCEIPAGTAISLSHLLSIIFYTDLTDLPRNMKQVCWRKYKTEPIQDISKRHSEFVNWLKLLQETLQFYGNKYKHSNKHIYHGLSKKLLLDQFKAKFYVPTSTSTVKDVAKKFAGPQGIILEFAGLESIGDPYFDCRSISAYPDEAEYLFFATELNIYSIQLGSAKKPLKMTPLSLFQSIISGAIIIDKTHLETNEYQEAQTKLNKYLDTIFKEKEQKDEEEMNESEKYQMDMLLNFWEKNNKKIFINKSQCNSKITMSKLKKRFIDVETVNYDNGGKSYRFKGWAKGLLDLVDVNKGGMEIRESYEAQWRISRNQVQEFVKGPKDSAICSKVFKLGPLTFYAQWMLREEGSRSDDNKEEENDNHNVYKTVRMAFILYRTVDDLKPKKRIISADFFCKELNKYYIRVHQHKLAANATKDENSRIEFTFDLKLVEDFLTSYDKEGKTGKDADLWWEICVRDETDETN